MREVSPATGQAHRKSQRDHLVHPRKRKGNRAGEDGEFCWVSADGREEKNGK